MIAADAVRMWPVPLSWTVLGAGTPYPRPGNACSGYLLAAGEQRVWVDAGPGTLANLQRYTALTRLSAVWVSHMHADHSADLLAAYYALAYGGLAPKARLPVFGPAGWAGRLAGFLGKPGPGFLDRVFEVRELHDGHQAGLGDLRLTARAVHHEVEAYALRATCEGHTLAYSGDTGPCRELAELAAGADLLVCEAGAAGRQAGMPQWHQTPEDAGEMARRAGAGRLLVTHVTPSLTPGEAVRRAARVFGGPTLAAREGDVHTA
jgi:ribonuclease BN (tRNA processing enzyme)